VTLGWHQGHVLGAGHRFAPAPSAARTKVRLVRLRPLSEAECYARCYGDRGEESVRIVRLERRRPRYGLLPTGEDLRRSFEERLNARDEEEEAA
jgi:hypothetical protein